MSANMRTPWLAKTSHFFSARFQWPGGAGAVTAPTGTWSIEGTNTPTDATGSVIVTPASGQPAGSAGSLAADNVQSSLAFVALTYTASGGSGTGAVAVAVIGF
jgi:hypothetical protein